jgi:bifunctional NMN adenylyltransferase/nudix hydrolase
MNVGVVIGRFQVESLHNGHRFLIDNALKNHRKVVVFVGVSPISLTRYDPLDYPTRERMIRQEFPDVIILPLHDRNSDEVWSKQVDDMIKTVVPNVSSAVLYGGRDSFIPHYKGQYSTQEIESEIAYQSGTEQRKEIGKVIRSSHDFRAGIIYATQNTFPGAKMAVDIALVKTAEHKIVLGRKPHESLWRLPGVFVDPTDTSLEFAACRELMEETSISNDISNMKYARSFLIDDWRFRQVEEAKIVSALFVSEYTWGALKAGDDLEVVEWKDLDINQSLITPSHRQLLAAIVKG